jgi:hypothetical protein
MSEHGQGYEGSGRPSIVFPEVWPVAADKFGLWLLTGEQGPIACQPVMDDAKPHAYVDMALMQAGLFARTRVTHQMSTRTDHDSTVGRNYEVYTFLAAVEPSGFVLDCWPEAKPITAELARVGNPETHGAMEPPRTVRLIDALRHALREMRLLSDPESIKFDATVAAKLPELWTPHLISLEPLFRQMYGREHQPA